MTIYQVFAATHSDDLRMASFHGLEQAEEFAAMISKKKNRGELELRISELLNGEYNRDWSEPVEIYVLEDQIGGPCKLRGRYEVKPLDGLPDAPAYLTRLSQQSGSRN